MDFSRFVLRGEDLILVLALEAVGVGLVSVGAAWVVKDFQAPPRAKVVRQARQDDSARVRELQRQVENFAIIERRREARAEVEKRELNLKSFAELYVHEQMGFPASTPWLWLRSDYKVHIRPGGWIVEGLVIDAGSMQVGFWSAEIVKLGDGAQGTEPTMEPKSLVWNLLPVVNGKVMIGHEVQGPRDPDWPRLIFKD